MNPCPPWCVADHPAEDPAEDRRDSVRHRGETHAIPVVLEGRGSEGPHVGELLVEVSRRHDELAAWVYLGDGWTGFSLSLDSANRISAALRATLRAAGTLDATGL